MAALRRDHVVLAGPALPTSLGAPDLGWPVRPAPRGLAPVVLVVEHDPDLREELVGALRAAWLIVDQAPDGLAALYALAQRTPDAVILDMDVPEVTGHRVYQVLRQDPTTRRCPVIMLASASRQEVCPRAVEAPPPECFLEKPVQPDLVLRELLRTGAVRAHAHA